MDTKEKKRLQRQLEGQAHLLLSETSDLALVTSLLTACSALLRAAERNLPASFTAQEFDRVYAGYLGLAGGVSRFSQSGQAYLNQTYTTLLRQQMDAVKQLQQERKELEGQLTQTESQQANERQAVSQLKDQVASTQRACQTAEAQRAELAEQVQTLQDKLEALKTERESLQRQREQFEPDLDALLQEVSAAKERYQEMVAYYAELERIQAGMQAEGFVDMASFTQAVAEMNRQGVALMADYDRLLGNVLTDVETLQQKVNARRRAGN